MHTIAITDETDATLIDHETLGEFIDLFFASKDSKFKIIVSDGKTAPPNDSIRGSCRRISGEFTINLWVENIRRHMRLGVRLGGNVTLARTVKHGVYLVLAHELRHAYQTMFHDFKHSHAFNAGKYMAKASEIDARAFVDSNYEAVSAFIEVEPMELGSTESLIEMMVGEIVDNILGSSPRLSDDEVWDLAMTLPGDEQANFNTLHDSLEDRGVEITTC